MPTEMMTMCFHTRDAVRREGGSFTFRLPSDRLRSAATKVALASCEFPIMQWTVEEAWDRVYVNEGVRLASSAAAALHLVERVPGDAEPDGPEILRLPPRLNRVRRAEWFGGALAVECAEPHGLWDDITGAPLRAAFDADAAGVRLVGGTDGDVVLSVALRDGDLQPTSPTAFRCRAGLAARAGAGAGALFLVSPAPPSPRHLCEWLSEAARNRGGARLVFRYEADRDRVALEVRGAVAGTMLRLLPTPLARLCGLSTMSVRCDASGAVVWPSEATHGLWEWFELPCGVYAPCHRPMCTGQPLRFGPEMESAANRLYVPLTRAVEGTGGGKPPPHQLVFTDPDGRVYTCPVPPGRYASAAQLCRCLEITTDIMRSSSR